jgi:cobalt-zinc-cadmium efflux system outer membrane protein
VTFGLEHNPTLTAVRTQRGVAAAGVIIARQYPFNPVLQLSELGAGGPDAAGITNRAFNATVVRLDLEVRGQRGIRQDGAAATLTRTEWDIASQELTVAVALIRAYDTALYRQRRLELQDETIRLAQQVYEETRKLADLGKGVRTSDVVLARTGLNAARAQRGQAQTAVAVARADLRRQLGTDDDSFTLAGELVLPPPTTDRDELTQVAFGARPDLNSRRLMVAEAEALLRLDIANRYGNPSAGPMFEYNETRVTFVGLAMYLPIPVLNTRNGEIMQRRAQLTRAAADVRQVELQAGLDVQAALARLAAAQKWADSYARDVLPSLRQAREEMDRLFSANEVDVLKVIGVQQNYLQALGTYLDAQFEVSQATADLALAVGDHRIAMGIDPRPKPEPPREPAPNPAPAKKKPD